MGSSFAALWRAETGWRTGKGVGPEQMNMNRYLRNRVESPPPGSAVSGPWSVSASLRLRVSAVKVDRGQLQTAWVSGVARIFHSKSGYFTGHFTSKPRGFRGLRKNPLFFFLRPG